MCPAPPTPGVPWDALSGFAFNQAIKPFKSSAGMVFFATIITGSRDQQNGVVLQHVVRKGVNGSVHDVRAPLADAKRVAVGRNPGDPADADATGCARHVFRDYRLTE